MKRQRIAKPCGVLNLMYTLLVCAKRQDELLIQGTLCKMTVVVGGGSEEGTSRSRHGRVSTGCMLPSATPHGFGDHPQAFANGDVRRMRCLQVLCRICVLT
jgi:hypothetical protein